MKFYSTLSIAAVLGMSLTSSAMAAGSLAGPYVGVQLGLNQPSMTVEDSDCWYDCSAYTNSKLGVMPGIQAGWNWVSGSFLTGVSLETSFGSIKETAEYANWNYLSSGSYDINHDEEVRTKFKGVSSLRGRMGLMVDNTAIIVSAGFAKGRFDSELREMNRTADESDDYNSKFSGSMNGVVTGISIEHTISEHLSLGLDLSSYAFKTEQSNWTNVSDGSVDDNKSNHAHKLQNANLFLNWHF